MNFGIDVSKWQGDFDFKEAKREGIEFAVIKGGGGDGGLYTDSRFEENYKKCKETEIPVGAYWFGNALSNEEAKREAEYFYNYILKGRQFELPVYIDVESPAMLALGKDKLTEIVDLWCSYLENKGYFVGIYSSVYAFSVYMDDNKLKKYTHWVAQWAEKCTYPFTDILGIWQFGGDVNLLRSNIVSGVVCDQNYMYQNFVDVIKSGKFNGFGDTPNTDTGESDDNSIPASTQNKAGVKDIALEVIRGLWGVGTSRKEALTSAGYDYSEVQETVDKILAGTYKEPSSEALGNVGQIRENENAGDKENIQTFSPGDMVELTYDAVVYGTEKQFAEFVYSKELYILEISKNRAVISTSPDGDVTGAVDVKYLKKI